ncbi:MAG: twin-arginine translocase subunit TatC, partial [Microbacterium sp.]
MTAIDKQSAAGDTPRNERRMSLGAHLVELRRRLMISAAALVVAMIIAFFVTEPKIDVITATNERIADEHPEVV